MDRPSRTQENNIMWNFRISENDSFGGEFLVMRRRADLGAQFELKLV